MFTFAPFATTVIGSWPHMESDALCERLARTLDIPAWPQLPQRDFREGLLAQIGERLPGFALDAVERKIVFARSPDFAEALEDFYVRYLEDDVEAFAISPESASGLDGLSRALAWNDGEWVKGQVVGPVTFGMYVQDPEGRAILYDELLADVIVKAISMKARWQIERLQSARPVVLMAIDEPALAGFEKDQIRLSREQIIMMLDEVVAAIHQENAWAAVHCCAATDWSLILSSQANCLSLDAYGYMDSLAAYPAELRAFLDRGGAIIWGIVPTDERLEQVTPADLAERLWQGFSRLALKARIYDVTIGMDELAEHSLLSPACGLGTLSIAQADRALDCLVETAARLRARR